MKYERKERTAERTFGATITLTGDLWRWIDLQAATEQSTRSRIVRLCVERAKRQDEASQQVQTDPAIQAVIDEYKRTGVVPGGALSSSRCKKHATGVAEPRHDSPMHKIWQSIECTCERSELCEVAITSQS